MAEQTSQRDLRQFYSSDPYEVLGVYKNTPLPEIKKARNILAQEFHTDVNSSPEAQTVIQNINIAYRIIRDKMEKKGTSSDYVESDGTVHRSDYKRTSRNAQQNGVQTTGKELTVTEPTISNTEWGLVIGALATIDAVQLGLDLLAGAGVVINRFIDVAVGFLLAFYLEMRGQSMADPKRLGGLIATFVAEEIPVADALPFWVADGIYNMLLAKAAEKGPMKKVLQMTKKLPVGKIAEKALPGEDQKAA